MHALLTSIRKQDIDRCISLTPIMHHFSYESPYQTRQIVQASFFNYCCFKEEAVNHASCGCVIEIGTNTLQTLSILFISFAEKKLKPLAL